MSASFSAYEHEITQESLGIEFSTFVFFAADSAFERNFLGRAGWFTIREAAKETPEDVLG